MPSKDTTKKGVKDFSPEEKTAIAARADKIELSRVAKEFNTTWQVVSAIQRAERKGPAKNKKVKAKTTKKAKTSTKKVTPTEAISEKKKFTKEEKNAILARAVEIGATGAADEAGISKWTIFQWRKALKKSGVELAPLSKKRRAAGSKRAKAKKAATPAVKTEEATVETATPKALKLAKKKVEGVTSLELENKLLKERVATLTQQIEKLRAAIAKLA